MIGWKGEGTKSFYFSSYILHFTFSCWMLKRCSNSCYDIYGYLMNSYTVSTCFKISGRTMSSERMLLMHFERIQLTHFVVWLKLLERTSLFLFHQYTNLCWSIGCGSVLLDPTLLDLFLVLCSEMNLLCAILTIYIPLCSIRILRKLKDAWKEGNH